MSGIVGILNTDGTPVDRKLLGRMVDGLVFRGPDLKWSYVSGDPVESTDVELSGRRPRGDQGGAGAAGRAGVQVGLGQALLRSTRESLLETGPCSIDGNTWVTADARIDGREDLIRELKDHGCRPRAGVTDPELILHAYSVWGEACVPHLVGDFAFGLWDERRRLLLCARDHMGVVPFYYAKLDGCLVFGNTLNILRMHPRVSAELNEVALADFLLFWDNRDPASTAFEEIRRLPPAHTLVWSDGRVRIDRYWSLPEPRWPGRPRRPPEYVEEFRPLLRRAVADRLRTDRVAVALSGGLDSSAVAVVAGEIRGGDADPGGLSHYNFICPPLVEPEEARCADLVASALNSPIRYIDATARLADGAECGRVTPEPSDGWRRNVWDDMFQDMVTESHVRVLLTGVGADPALRPSRSYWYALRQAVGDWSVWQELAHQPLAYGKTIPRDLRRFARRHVARGLLNRGFPRWIDRGLVDRLHLRSRYRQAVEAGESPDALCGSPFWSNLLSSYNAGHWGAPVEVRHPFSDIRLLRFLQNVYPSPWLEGKGLLRLAMHGRLPEQVLHRRKVMSHGNPMNAMRVDGNVPPWMWQLASAPDLAGFVDRDVLLRELAAFDQPDVLRPIALAAWLRAQSGKVI